MEKVIGYTQGTFDMFHIGHLNLIKNAKRHCDYLIVGVNDDDLVESYKNKRPIVPLNERVEIVRAIKYVDEVIVTKTLNKKEVWRESTLQCDLISVMTGKETHVGRRPEKKWKAWVRSLYSCHIRKIHLQPYFARS